MGSYATRVKIIVITDRYDFTASLYSLKNNSL